MCIAKSKGKPFYILSERLLALGRYFSGHFCVLIQHARLGIWISVFRNEKQRKEERFTERAILWKVLIWLFCSSVPQLTKVLIYIIYISKRWLPRQYVYLQVGRWNQSSSRTNKIFVVLRDAKRRQGSFVSALWEFIGVVTASISTSLNHSNTLIIETE